jgi:hypothetical protein
MKTLTLLTVVILELVVTGPRRAAAQVSPNDKMTASFQEYLDSLATNPGSAFVSMCFGPGDGEKAIFVVPVGSGKGTLSLQASQKVYNGAGIRLTQDGTVTVIEGGGGEWSLRKLQFYADSLAHSEFRFYSDGKLKNLESVVPHAPCPIFK